MVERLGLGQGLAAREASFEQPRVPATPSEIAGAQGVPHGFAALGQTNINGTNDNVVTVAGQTNLYAPGNHDNFVVNFGGDVGANGNNPQRVIDAGEISVSVCGTSVSGQAAHITTNPGQAC